MMLYNFIKLNKIYFQFMIIIIMTIMNLIISNKLIMWMTLEISNMSFISMMIISKEYNSSILYFLISFLSSTILFISLMYYNLNYNFYMMFSIYLKISLMPFNMWFNMISKSINNINLAMLMTFMKFIPLYMMHSFIEFNKSILMMIMISMILSPILALNKMSLKLILSYSSIHQTSIMILLMYMNYKMFLLYFMIYSISTFMLLTSLNIINNKYKNEFINFYNKKMKIIFLLLMIIYSMFPPMITFIMKWTLIENFILMNNQFLYIALIMIISSFIMLWNYLNFMNLNIYEKNNFNKMNKNLKFNLNKLNFNLILITMTYLMYSYFNF